MNNQIPLGSEIPGTAAADGGGKDLSSVKEPVAEEKLRVVYARVPPHVRNHVKAQAALSGMSLTEYLTRFLLEAFPYSDADQPEGREGKQT